MLKQPPSQKPKQVKLKLMLRLRKFLRLKMKNLRKLLKLLDNQLMSLTPQKLFHLLHFHQLPNKHHSLILKN
jgi:hypothetical protein